MLKLKPGKWLAGMAVMMISPVLFAQIKNPAPALEGCFDGAAKFHRVNPVILRAIAAQESGGRVNAMNYNNNGTRDIGVMQINSSWLGTLSGQGISEASLSDGCVNIYVGAWILSRVMQRYGNTWQAIGAYHSATPHHNERYARAIYQRIQAHIQQQERLAAARQPVQVTDAGAWQQPASVLR